jgi:hypothetical protein
MIDDIKNIRFTYQFTAARLGRPGRVWDRFGDGSAAFAAAGERAAPSKS